MPEGLSRREALAAGVAGAAALAIAPAAARAAASGQGAALAALVRAEEDAVFVYRNSGLGDVGGPLAGQDAEHAKALATHVEALGMPIPEPRRDRDGLGPEALAVLEARGDVERWQAAMAFERSLIAGCAQHLAQLTEPNTVRTVATVMAGHAQQLVQHELSSRR